MSEIVDAKQEEKSTKENMHFRAHSQTVTMSPEPNISMNTSNGIIGLFCRRGKSIKPICGIILVITIVAVYMWVIKKQQPTVDSLLKSPEHAKGKFVPPMGGEHHVPVANEHNAPVVDEHYVAHVPDKEEMMKAQAAEDEVKQYAAFKEKHGVHAIPPLKPPQGEGDGKISDRHGAPKPKEFPVDILLEPLLHECTDENQPGVIILVDTQPGHAEYRNAIRNSWGKPENHKGENRDQLEWQVIFIVGTSDTHDAELKEENVKHNDILQGDFKDTPSEETRKFMMSFKWLAAVIDECVPRFVLKSRDDVFINLDAIQEWMEKNFPEPYELFMGRVVRRDVPIRQKSDPMYVSEVDYPDDIYPDLVASPLYLFSFDVVVLMGYSLKKVTPIAQADAYIGILARTIGVKPFDNTHFRLLFKPSFKCFFIGLFFVHGTSAQEHKDIFRTIHKARYSYECAGVHGLKIPQAHNDLLKFGKIKQPKEDL
ncbi:unnamed protein product [Owenia fusiformis]|uniref:Hexosyltransferase n=1 Tax=Owenia fusiformis TaxID=6347 RepID=A0A8J1TC96_OWEFU|nr:unnamed protein product [Owenia fusiformis]